jgi:antimicrobial peptide system SdpA family protein
MLKYFTYLIFFAILVTVPVVALSVAISGTTIELNHSVKNVVKAVFPQGWGFFTKDPQEKSVDIYLDSGEGRVRISTPNQSASNYWGFSRKSRMIGMEVSTVLSLVGQRQPSWCVIKDAKRHLAAGGSSWVLKSPKLHYLTPGNYVLVRRSITPWAWYDQPGNFIPYEELHVRIR